MENKKVNKLSFRTAITTVAVYWVEVFTVSHIMVTRLTNHVIIHERASLLDEPSNCKWQILDRPLVDWATEFREPLTEWKKRTYMIIWVHRFTCRVARSEKQEKLELPSTPSLGPESGFVRFVWTEIVTVKSIAAVYLQSIWRTKFCKQQIHFIRYNQHITTGHL